MVGFGLPRRLTTEERHYIGECSVGSAFVVRRNPTKIAAIIKNYVLQPHSILFEIAVEDDALSEAMMSGDLAPEYEWLNPIESMITYVI